MSGANDKTGVGNGTGEWQTPPDLFAALHQQFAFNLDAFASHANHLTSHYLTAEGEFCACLPGPGPGNPQQINALDGLAGPWRGHRVFGNPPYSRGFVMQIVEKAISERDHADVIVLLLPAAVDTKWYRALEKMSTIWLLPKRVRFINPETGQPGDSPPTGHGVFLLRPSWMDR